MNAQLDVQRASIKEQSNDAYLKRKRSIHGQSEKVRKAHDKAIITLAQAVGALVLSCACPDDSPLADEILDICRVDILASLSPQTSAS